MGGWSDRSWLRFSPRVVGPGARMPAGNRLGDFPNNTKEQQWSVPTCTSHSVQSFPVFTPTRASAESAAFRGRLVWFVFRVGASSSCCGGTGLHAAFRAAPGLWTFGGSHREPA